MRNLIKKQLRELKKQIISTKNKIKNSPEGKLVLRVTRSRTRFYRKTDTQDIYLGSDQQMLIRKLAQKRYNTELLTSMESYLKVLETTDKMLENITLPTEVHDKLPEAFRNITEPFTVLDSFEVQNWYMTRNPRNDAGKFRTKNGIHVKSKSEVFIADALFEAGIPFVYEERLEFETNDWERPYETFYPDFTILNVRTGESFYWEHFGKMDNTEYLNKTLYKLESYARHGIVSGKNLIITYESMDHPINMEYVNQLIQTFLR